MVDFKDNFSSESFYPDSNYYLEEENMPKETLVSEDQISNMGESFEWPNSYWLLRKGQMVG